MASDKKDIKNDNAEDDKKELSDNEEGKPSTPFNNNDAGRTPKAPSTPIDNEERDKNKKENNIVEADDEEIKSLLETDKKDGCAHGYVHGKMIIQGNEAQEEEITSRKVEIVRKLIAEFDLEKVMHKYSSSGSLPYKVDVNDFSLDCTHDAAKLKARLVYLLGTDELDMCDRKHMDYLRESLKREQEKNQRKRERERSEEENRRIRKLIALGVIQSDDTEFAIRNGYGEESIPKHRGTRNNNKKDRRSLMESEWYNPEDGLVTERSKPTEVTKWKKKDEDGEDGEKGDEDKDGEEQENEEEKNQHPDPNINKLYETDSIEGLYVTARDVLNTGIDECGSQKGASGGGGGEQQEQQTQQTE